MKKFFAFVFCLSLVQASYADWKDALNGAGAVLFGAGVARGLSGGPHAELLIEAAAATQLVQPVIEAGQKKKVTAQAVSAILHPIFFYAFAHNKSNDSADRAALLSFMYLTAAYAKENTLSLLYIPGFYHGLKALTKKFFNRLYCS